MRSIITDYAHSRFRSRLEARWACFFDLCGWRWEYEPPEQDGWIPDFLLIGAVRPILVEVKPINWIGDDLVKQAKAAPELDKVWKYVRSVAPDEDSHEFFIGNQEVLILGSYPHGRGLGVFAMEEYGCRDVAVLALGYPPRRLDFFSQYLSQAYRMGGQHSGDGRLLDEGIKKIDRLWREAGNAVQWMRR